MTTVKEKPRTRTGAFSVDRLLGVKAANNLKLASAVESGLGFESFERLSRLTGLSTEQIRTAVRMSPRTLTRRRSERRLSPEESDRLVSVSRLFSMTYELFEGRLEAGLTWFVEPNRALGGRSPIEAASTETGAREVEDLIGRLEHGVFV